MERLAKHIGSVIEAERIKQNLTQSALGKKAKMTQASISEIEDGKRKITLDSLNDLCKALNVKLWVMVRRAEFLSKK